MQNKIKAFGNPLEQRWAMVRKGHCPAEFRFNPNQTYLYASFLFNKDKHLELTWLFFNELISPYTHLTAVSEILKMLPSEDR